MPRRRKSPTWINPDSSLAGDSYDRAHIVSCIRVAVWSVGKAVAVLESILEFDPICRGHDDVEKVINRFRRDLEMLEGLENNV